MVDRKRTAVEHWLTKGENDLRAGHASLQANPPITEDVCFHSQQAIEKSLKAFLVEMGTEFPKTHDLTKLVRLCGKSDEAFLELITLVEGMTTYAVTERYPDDWREILLDEAQEAIGKAEKAVAFVKRKIK